MDWRNLHHFSGADDHGYSLRMAMEKQRKKILVLNKNNRVWILWVLFFKVFCYLILFTVKVHPKALSKAVSPNNYWIRLQA
jgi:hypothetical protein